MFPLSFLTSVAAALASWVGGGGGLGEDKPVGNMKNGNTNSSQSVFLIPNFQVGPEGTGCPRAFVEVTATALRQSVMFWYKTDNKQLTITVLYLNLALPLSCFCW